MDFESQRGSRANAAPEAARRGTLELSMPGRNFVSRPYLERWTRPMQELGTKPCFVHPISEETLRGALEQRLHVQASSSVIPCGSSRGASAGVPIETLEIYLRLELLNRILDIPRGIVIIAPKATEAAQADLDVRQREALSQIAFWHMEVAEKLKEWGLKLSAVFDTDLMSCPEYHEARAELAAARERSFPLAFEQAVLAETARRMYGACVKSGWTSYESMAEFCLVKQGLESNRGKIAGCDLPTDFILARTFPGEFGFVYGKPARNFAGEVAESSPLEVRRSGGSAEVSEHGRLILHADEQPERIICDLFDPPAECGSPAAERLWQERRLADIKRYYELCQLMEHVCPGFLPATDTCLADLDVTSRVVTQWENELRERVRGNATERERGKAEQWLWQARLAEGNARAEALRLFLPAIIEQFGKQPERRAASDEAGNYKLRFAQRRAA